MRRAGHCQRRADASEAEITNQPITAEKVFRQLLSKYLGILQTRSWLCNFPSVARRRRSRALVKWHGFTDWLAPLNLLEICSHRATKARWRLWIASGMLA